MVSGRQGAINRQGGLSLACIILEKNLLSSEKKPAQEKYAAYFLIFQASLSNSAAAASISLKTEKNVDNMPNTRMAAYQILYSICR